MVHKAGGSGDRQTEAVSRTGVAAREQFPDISVTYREVKYLYRLLTSSLSLRFSNGLNLSRKTLCFRKDLLKTKSATTASAMFIVAMEILSYFAILGAIAAPEEE